MTKDRTRYFRVEARELLDRLSRGILDLESSPGDKALVARLLRDAHTLKGAARVVQQQAIGDLAHAAEDVLGAHREDASPPVPRERIDALLRVLDEIAAAVATLEPQAQLGTDRAAQPLADDTFRSVRVDLREMDDLLESVLEAGVQVTALRHQLGRIDHAGEVTRAIADQLAARRADGDGFGGPALRMHPLVDELRRTLEEAQRALAMHADRTEREVAEIRNAADRLRLLPARAVFGPLERAARDAARTLDREIAFETAGGEVRVEANVLSAIRNALLHVVRNAVAHGVEPPAERAQRGKPAAGKVRLDVERRGNRVAFVCRDDGRGIDFDAVREVAVRKGVISSDGATGLQGDALAALLLRGGLSTSASVTGVSGRGVGLDVVRDTASRLTADVAIHSESGLGTAVEIAVPVSLAALTALQVETAGTTVALPLDAVQCTRFVEPARVARTAGGTGISHEGNLIPFVPLPTILGQAMATGPRRFWSAIIVRAGTRLVAVGADRLVGTCEMMVRPLPGFVDADAAVAGASLDPEGNPQLVLDPAGLVAAAAAIAGPQDGGAPVQRPPILVVDDSLTTRMLEQSILESAGYEVELAVSGEEALQKSRHRRFGLFVVDIEMPGMDGLEFVRLTRADPRLSSIPAIVLTSRGALEDRRHGLDAGASAYIVKSEFDQGRLLATIKELLG